MLHSCINAEEDSRNFSIFLGTKKVTKLNEKVYEICWMLEFFSQQC